MRVLIFDVDGQKIKPNPQCDFSGIVKGTKGYLYAKFNLSPSEWGGCGKLAVFTCFGEEYPERLEGDICLIPHEALSHNRFKVHVVGIRPGYRIQTNTIEIIQEG